MSISASMVKDLRERTGAGMLDCKNALQEANGDIELAVEELRKKGVAAAEKKSGRIAAEGIIATASNDSLSVLLEVNCETDFVAKDDSFKGFVNGVAKTVLSHTPKDVAALNDLTMSSGVSVESARQELITKIGENVSVRRFLCVNKEAGSISNYLHGARIGVLVKLATDDDSLGRDIAMHIAASRPYCIAEQDMDAAVVEKEKEIFRAQAAESGKPADIVEKMIGGRIQKFLKENTLLGQPFVKNPDQTVGKLLQENNTQVIEMVRFEVGEGIEKRSEDFVAEVMAQASE